MGTNQGDRQASVRAVTGTAWTYEGDWHALFDQAGIAVGTFNGRLLAWINSQLGSSYTELNGAMYAYAVSQGFTSWGAMGTFSPSSFNIFVDSSRADDTGNGLTQLTAKKTIAAASALVTTNSRIGLAKGSSWREMLAISANGVSVGTYGTGAAPILDASDVAANGSFSASGTGNAYQISWTHAVSSSASTFSVFENGSRLKRAASLAACGSTAGTFFAPTPTSGGATQTIYVNPTGGGNITANGKTYEITRRDTCVIANTATGVTIDGLYAKRACLNDGAIIVRNSGTIQNCTAEDGQKHNVLIGGGCVAQNVIATKTEGAAVAGGATMFVFYDGGSTTSSASFVNCSAIATYADETNNRAGTIGFYSHSASGGNDTFTVQGCTVDNVQCAVSGEAKHLVVTNLSANNTDVGVQPLGAQTGADCTIVGMFHGYTDAAKKASKFVANTLSNITTTVRGSVFDGGFVGASGVYAGAGSLIVETSTLVSGGSGSAFFAAAGASLTLRNNIVSGFANGIESYAIYTYAGAGNVWHNTPNLMLNSVSYGSLGAWRTATGQDLASISTDPGFVNATFSTWRAVSDATINGTAAQALYAGTTFYGVSPVAPSISAVTLDNTAPAVGDVLTASVAATGLPAPAISFAWNGAGTPVNTRSYTVVSGDGTHTLAATATATSTAGSATLASSATTAVPAPPSTPAWVMTDSAAAVAALDLDFLNNRYWYNGTEYTDFATITTALGMTLKGQTRTTAGLVITGAFANDDRVLLPFFTGYVNQTETWVMEVSAVFNNNGRVFSDLTNDSYFTMSESTTGAHDTVTLGGAGFCFATTGDARSWDAGEVNKIGFATGAAGSSLCFNAGSIATTTQRAASGSPFAIGAGNQNFTERAPGNYRRITYFAKKLSNADLQAKTT